MAVSPYWLTELALTDVLRVQVVADYVKLPEGLPLR